MGEKNPSRATMAGAGVHAKTYIAQRLVLDAKRLLAHRTQSVQSIALEWGLEDAANFGKFFKRVDSATPGAFRLRNGITGRVATVRAAAPTPAAQSPAPLLAAAGPSQHPARP